MKKYSRELTNYCMVMKFKTIQEWIPADGLTLEENALTTVKSDYNTLVIAGPGAGKTELLAQRACYLLETNTCKFPKKILAISFKRDAAHNLKERVNKRCGVDLASRFDSLTFDAFAKMLLDRFYKGLPKEYRINSEYEIFFDDRVILGIYKQFDETYVNTNTNILNRYHKKLPFENNTIHKKVFTELLKSGGKTYLSFKMIMRLAELIIISNSKIKEYLQKTYSYIFLDEFQDTTFIQYEFLNSCFGDSNAVMTAVGDDKQRIMLWAGANPEIFTKYQEDYDANILPLQMNFRSAPRLVALQNYLITNLLRRKETVVHNPTWNKSEGEASLWIFENPDKEMEYLFAKVTTWINTNKINPRDICILVKQQLNKYVGELIRYFNENGISARDESALQDLLTEDIILFVINVLYVISDKKSAKAKSQVLSFLANINSFYDDKQILNEEVEFNQFIVEIRECIEKEPVIQIEEIIKRILTFANVNKIKSLYPNYRNKRYLTDLIDSLSKELKNNLSNYGNLKQTLDSVMGIGVVPVMTIHKSKGLEYHSVIFIGLEDGAFWSYEKQPDEDKCAFFVALSRAKERVIFTFSKERMGRYKIEKQSFSKIKELFDNLGGSQLVNFEEIPD